VFFRAINTEIVANVTGHHFFGVFAPSYFLITKMRVAKEEFFPLCILAVAYGLGLGRVLNILVLFPSLLADRVDWRISE